MDQLISKCMETIQNAEKILVFTGAGLSTDSGIPDFRSPGGLWEIFNPDEYAAYDTFVHRPDKSWELFRAIEEKVRPARPNPAHEALARLEKLGIVKAIVTQNVDGLHQRAGSRRIVEIHGSLWRLTCPTEGKVSENYEVPLSELPPRCSCGAILRPDVVWFGESLDGGTLQRAYSALEGNECVLVTGTSGVVQPVASFPLIAKRAGAFVIEINRETTPLSPLMDESFQGKAGE